MIHKEYPHGRIFPPETGNILHIYHGEVVNQQDLGRVNAGRVERQGAVVRGALREVAVTRMQIQGGAESRRLKETVKGQHMRKMPGREFRRQNQRIRRGGNGYHRIPHSQTLPAFRR